MNDESFFGFEFEASSRLVQMTKIFLSFCRADLEDFSFVTLFNFLSKSVFILVDSKKQATRGLLCYKEIVSFVQKPPLKQTIRIVGSELGEFLCNQKDRKIQIKIDGDNVKIDNNTIPYSVIYDPSGYSRIIRTSISVESFSPKRVITELTYLQTFLGDTCFFERENCTLNFEENLSAFVAIKNKNSKSFPVDAYRQLSYKDIIFLTRIFKCFAQEETVLVWKEHFVSKEHFTDEFVLIIKIPSSDTYFYITMKARLDPQCFSSVKKMLRGKNNNFFVGRIKIKDIKDFEGEYCFIEGHCFSKTLFLSALKQLERDGFLDNVYLEVFASKQGFEFYLTESIFFFLCSVLYVPNSQMPQTNIPISKKFPED